MKKIIDIPEDHKTEGNVFMKLKMLWVKSESPNLKAYIKDILINHVKENNQS